MRPLMKTIALFCALCALFALAVPAALTVPGRRAARMEEAMTEEAADADEALLVLSAPGAKAAVFETSAPIIPCSNGYTGSKPAAGVYMTQTRKHTCTLIAATMMLRNYACLHGTAYVGITESLTNRCAWSKAYGLAQHFTVGKLEVSSTPEIRYAKDKKQYLIEKLREHPEGIVIYDTGAPHAIFLFGYDQTRDIFYCADTVNSRGGRPIQLVNSIIRGETQQDKINTIDKIWFVVDQLPMAA